MGLWDILQTMAAAFLSNQCGFVIPDWECHRFKYCPNCKARMVQKGEDNDG